MQLSKFAQLSGRAGISTFDSFRVHSVLENATYLATKVYLLRVRGSPSDIFFGSSFLWPSKLHMEVYFRSETLRHG